jgi:hypothetical protein
MTTIFVKDDLRASVEAATGGHVTVLYTAAGHPSYMVRIPKFNLQDIDAGLGTGVHPAFVVNGVEKDEILIGQHLGIQKDGNLLSIPGVLPSASANFDTFRAWAAANGPGWHMMTAAEWAAIALWCWKNGFQPRGNNYYGQDIGSKWETAPRVDGGVIGNASGNGKSYTGAGPASWRHDGTFAGIADMNGNIWEWNSGFRLKDGEIQIIPNNNAADSTVDVSATSTEWKAIASSGGALVAPGTAGTLKYDASGSGGTGNVVLSDAVTNRTGTVGADDDGTSNFASTLESMTAKAGLTVPAIAKALGIYPVAGTGLGGDSVWARNHGERLPLAGGHYNPGVSAGVFARTLNLPRSYVSHVVGARPAYVS